MPTRHTFTESTNRKLTISINLNNNIIMNRKYEQELQDEILQCEDIHYDNENVQEEYLEHLWN